MPICYLCGKKIEEGKGIRKEVYTGHSRTLVFSAKDCGMVVVKISECA